MSNNKFTERLKEGVSVKELEEFTRKHTTEVLTVLAIVIATASSCFDFFTGPKLSLFFAALGAILAVIFPVQVELGLKKFYDFVFQQETSTQIILRAVQFVIAIFIPFISFALMGLLAGSSFHYYIRHAQIVAKNAPEKPKRKFEDND